MESLGQFVDWVPVCPEVESGLDAPRESMRLVQDDGRIRLLTNKTAQDHTTRMRTTRAAALRNWPMASSAATC